MVSNSEKTNAKNLENTHIANATIETIPIYNTSNELIIKQALIDFEAGLGSRMQTVNATFAAEQTAISAQTAAFKLVPEKITKIMKAVKGQNISKESLDHLMTTVRRLRGVRVSDKTPDNPATPEDESKATHSVSRRSIAGILESLDLFDEQIQAETNYKPNEEEYKKEAISAWITSLHALRNARLEAQAATTNARQDRDDFGYDDATGLIPRMNALKNYAESILDKSDARLKKIKGLKFVNMKR
ncbi:hypothetical protein BH10ACI1_BH10ACI1_27260 [soil metagenome]